jgi:DNA-binding MarR family transcriptional regulator/SAM-dependent methyltransferase
MNAVATTDSKAEALSLLKSIRALVRRFSVSERADVACCGMTVAQAATLEVLKMEGAVRLSTLGRRLGISPSTLTRNLQRLEERGLIERTADPEDARAAIATLTPAGEKTAAELEEQEIISAAGLLKSLPPERRGRVVQALEDLLEAIREATEPCCPGAFDHLMNSETSQERPDPSNSRWPSRVDASRRSPEEPKMTNTSDKSKQASPAGADAAKVEPASRCCGESAAERRKARDAATHARAAGCCGSSTGPKNASPKPASGNLLPGHPEGIVETVRERYGDIARGEGGGCCGSSSADVSRKIGYDAEELAAIPEGANLGLGCGAPVAHLKLKPGEVVLDLGSGGGIDVFLAAGKVGPAGKVIGVDMTPEMIEKATAHARQAGIDHVEFRHGRLEELPVENGSVDAVTSNCVINLVPDKAAVFREVARVLRTGGRLAVSDVILDGKLPEAVEKDVLAHAGCVSGAMQRERYFGILREAGLGHVEIVKDEDFLGALEKSQPAEVREFEERTGVRLSELHGVVRSVTYRATKTTA